MMELSIHISRNYDQSPIMTQNCRKTVRKETGMHRENITVTPGNIMGLGKTSEVGKL